MYLYYFEMYFSELDKEFEKKKYLFTGPWVRCHWPRGRPHFVPRYTYYVSKIDHC